MDTSNRTGGESSARFWRTPGFVIACGSLIAMLAFGPRSSMGLFTVPLSEANGWGRDVFALSIAIQNLAWGIGTPFAGALCDRYGPAPVLGISGLLYALGLVLMPFADTPLMLHLSSGLLIGLGLAGASFGIVIAGFSRIVPPEKRSWAMGVATAAGSIGQSPGPGGSRTQFTIDTLGRLDDVEQFADVRAPPRRRAHLMDVERFLKDASHVVPRVQGGVRILEDHLRPPPERAEFRGAHREDILPGEADVPGGRFDEAEEAASRRRLAGAGFTDQAERLARVEREAHVLDGVRHTRRPPQAPLLVVLGEPSHFHERHQ